MIGSKSYLNFLKKEEIDEVTFDTIDGFVIKLNHVIKETLRVVNEKKNFFYFNKVEKDGQTYYYLRYYRNRGFLGMIEEPLFDILFRINLDLDSRVDYIKIVYLEPQLYPHLREILKVNLRSHTILKFYVDFEEDTYFK